MSSLLFASLQGSIAAIFKLVCVLSVGALSAHWGFLSAVTIPLLSSFTFIWVSGCQVLSNLGREFNLEKLAIYWPLLIWGIYTILLGYLVGWLYCRIFKPPKEFETSIVACTAYANTIGLPIVIFDSLSSSLYTTPTQTALEAYQRAVAYTFVYSVPWNLLMFIVGYPYVLELKSNPTPAAEGDDGDNVNDNVNDDDDDDGRSLLTQNNQLDSEVDQCHVNNTNNITSIDLVDKYYAPFSLDIDDDPNYPSAPLIKGCSAAAKQYNRGCDFITFWFHKLFFSHLPNSTQFTMTMIFTNPPTVATLVSLFIGVVPPIKDPFYNNDGIFHWVIQAVDFIALASAPLSNLVTAANIYHSVHRNFGPKARELCRIIDLVNQAQKLDEMDPITHHPTLPNNDGGKDSNPIDEDGDTFDDNLFIPQPTLSLPSRTSTNHSQTPKIRPNPTPQQQQQQHLATSQSNLTSIRPLFDTTQHLPPQQLLHPMEPTVVITMGATRARSPSSVSIISAQSNFSHKTITDIDNSDYVIPLHATGGSMLRDRSDLQMLNRTHSYLPKQPTVSLSFLRQQNVDQIIPHDPTSNQFTDHNSRLINNNNNNNTMSRVDYIMSRVDSSVPIEYDPKTGRILPLPRLSWSNMFGIAVCRLIIVPLIVWLSMLFTIVVGWEEIFLPTAAGAIFRTYIILSACSVPADSILMIITKAGRTRQSMAMSLTYVVQYIMCVITIPTWLVLINATNSHLNK